MAGEYSVETCRKLERQFQEANLYRPMRVQHYDAGTELEYRVRAVTSEQEANVTLKVEKFVGGGFAGQVYRVRIREVDSPSGPIEGLEPGKALAMKILIPPSGFSLLFRNFIYGVGFQGPFQLQSNPQAARSGALWQKFIRRAAKIRFGDEQCVNDILVTFVDGQLGSCGELSEWIDGRTWRLEVDDRLDLLRKWCRGEEVDTSQLGSPEYRAKRKFMDDFVKLLHDMGAIEFARQYEWSTCKSQPNCLKRLEFDDDAEKGLVAVDFRAGLALLPFLPMSPGDFKLILMGLLRGSLVQFDRGDLNTLKQFMDAHPDDFADMQEAYEHLVKCEDIYRNSLPDITHNHIRLLYSGNLWKNIFSGAVTGWRVRNIIDTDRQKSLQLSKFLTLCFFLCHLLGGLGILTAIGGILGKATGWTGWSFGFPASWTELLGQKWGLFTGGGLLVWFSMRMLRKIWGRGDLRRHYRAIIGSWDYFRRSLRGRIAEKVIQWHRAGRVDGPRALKTSTQLHLFILHQLLSVLPVTFHRLLSDRQYARETLYFIFVRPVKLYFNAELREQWLRDMVAQGQKNHLVTDEDARTILGQIKEPFIQKYLKSLAVHVCTLPVTQMVSVFIALVYWLNHRDNPNAWKIGLGIIAAFQVTPISPGSLCRGLYVVYLVIKERNFKDYHIAVFLGFFKYVGYLAFPIQMAYRYPVLARFMAAHWATEAVHIVPVFGEKGALLEHGIFNLFYNVPLTIRRRMQSRAEYRKHLKDRYWHIIPAVIIISLLFILTDYIYLSTGKEADLPILRDIWYLVIVLSMSCGALITLGAGGLTLSRRIVSAVIGGCLCGIIYAIAHTYLIPLQTTVTEIHGLLTNIVWRVFVFSLFAAIGAIVMEVKLPEPPGEIRRSRLEKLRTVRKVAL